MNKKNLLAAALAALFMSALLTSATSCSREDNSKEQCSIDDHNITDAEAEFNSFPTKANCEATVDAYDKYIKHNCPDKDSYRNSRDAFKKKNCP